MINKKNLWFLTLFSLILVLSVYYITMPNELLLTKVDSIDTNKVSKINNRKTKNPTKKVLKEESNLLATLRVEADEKTQKEIDELKKILNDSKSTTEEKNNAYEKMKLLNITKGEEEEHQKQIKDNFKLESFVKIDGDNINVVVLTDKLDKGTANKIMRLIQKKYDIKKYITVEYKK